MSGEGAVGRARRVNPEFKVHRLNDKGLEKAERIAERFDALLTDLTNIIPSAGEPEQSRGREIESFRRHLEQACFYAKKAMSSDPANQLT